VKKRERGGGVGGGEERILSYLSYFIDFVFIFGFKIKSKTDKDYNLYYTKRNIRSINSFTKSISSRVLIREYAPYV
jgi:hypothetical protein